MLLLLTLIKSNYMRKLALTFLILLLIGSSSPAQKSSKNGNTKFTLGILGGLNLPRLSGGDNNELSRDYTSRSGGAFGITSAVDLSANFSLRLDILYSSEGGKRDGIQAFDASAYSSLIPPGTYFYAAYNNESILNYIELPLMIKYNFPLNKTKKLFAECGPYIGYLLNAKQKTSGSSMIYADRAESMIIVPQEQSFDASTNITSSINHYNFGMTAGLGFAQKVNASEIFLDVRGAYGMIVIQKDSNNGTSHNGNLLIDLGYALHF